MTPTTTTPATDPDVPALASSDGSGGERIASQLAYLTRVLKMPTIAKTWSEVADQARDLGWSHEQYLAAVLERRAADREAAGTMMRIRTAHFPAMKTLVRRVVSSSMVGVWENRSWPILLPRRWVFVRVIVSVWSR